jgi:flagellar hook protein FlgE
MSVFAAMNTAVSGLGAQARKMGHISDNIANVSTVAYKKITTDFSTLVTQSGRRTHTPGGVISTPYYNISSQGQMQSSAKSTHMGISGDGFFIVRNYPDTADTEGLNKKNLFTRKGDFTIDASGNLVNSSGYYLMGRAYNIDTDTLVAGDLTSVNVANMAGIATATKNTRLGLNLPAEAAVEGQPQITRYNNAWLDTAVAADSTYTVTLTPTLNAIVRAPITIEVSVATGADPGPAIALALNSHVDLEADWAAIGAGADTIAGTADDTGGLTVTGPDGYDFAITISEATLGAQVVTANTSQAADPGLSAIAPGTVDNYVEQTLYDAQGQAQTVRMEFSKVDTNAWEMRLVQQDISGDWQDISGVSSVTFNVDGTLNSVTDTTGADGASLTWDPDTEKFMFTPPVDASQWTWQWDQAQEQIAMNIGVPSSPIGITQYSSEFSVTDLTQDGLPYGQFTGVSIDEYGDLYAQYGNGATVRIYHLPLAVFTNADGLQNVDGNAYEATAFSGDPSILSPGVGRAGKVVSEALEGSSVDLAEEFTQMIQTQRAYSANSRVTTADQMTEEIIRIKS